MGPEDLSVLAAEVQQDIRSNGIQKVREYDDRLSAMEPWEVSNEHIDKYGDTEDIKDPSSAEYLERRRPEKQVSPLSVAEETYGKGNVEKIIRDKALQAQKDFTSLPYKMRMSIPTYSEKAWKEPIDVHESNWKMNGAKTFWSGRTRESGQKENTVQIINPKGNRPYLEHEMTHGLEAKTPYANTSEPDVALNLFEKYGDPSRAQELSGELSLTDRVKRFGNSLYPYAKTGGELNTFADEIAKSSEAPIGFKGGVAEIAKNPDHAYAYLTPVVREYYTEFGRHPETEYEIDDAIKKYMNKHSQNDFTLGALEAIKKLPYRHILGRILVEAPKGSKGRKHFG